MSELRRRYLLTALLAVALFGLAAVAGYFTKGDGADDTVRTAPTDSTAGVRGGLQSLNGDTLVVLTESGPRQFILASDATVEVLKPTTASTIGVGEWLNLGAMPHAQTVFAIVGLTLIPQALLQDQ